LRLRRLFLFFMEGHRPPNPPLMLPAPRLSAIAACFAAHIRATPPAKAPQQAPPFMSSGTRICAFSPA
jgi:hypothetical protein